jgi:hypothetical protein
MNEQNTKSLNSIKQKSMMKKKRNFVEKAGLFSLLFVLFSAQLFAQKVAGKVVDENKEPMPGVNVVVKGTTNGIITDTNGNYVIQPGNIKKDVLVFSFIGYEAKEIPVNGQSTINVTMSSSTELLNEVVAIGYGTMKKRLFQKEPLHWWDHCREPFRE